jgi:glycosyltransferase involved in cell wall biosynthesis
MKNILIISAVFPPEPVVSAKLSEDIAVELSNKYNVTVLAPKPTRPFGFKLNSGNNNYKFKLINTESYTCPESKLFGRLRESLSFGMYSTRYIKQNKRNIDLIYMNSWPIFSQFLIVKMAKKYDICVITHIQDIYPESLINKNSKFKFFLKIILMPIDKYILKKSHTIIAISENMKQYLSKTRNIHIDKIEVVKNWQSEESFTSFKPTENFKNNHFTFMYLGNIGPVAGVDFIIDAFVEANLSSAKLLIAGSGSKKEELQKKVIKLNAQNIEFIDVPDGKVPEVQNWADVLLLPIKKGAALSSIPSKLPAYMFSKKPIIASVDEGSETANVIFESGCGWVIAPENLDEFSNILSKVVEINKVELEKIGNKGFNYAIKNLSKINNLSKIIKILNNSLVL